jgi:tetrachlorobenzoquinone reductase
VRYFRQKKRTENSAIDFLAMRYVTVPLHDPEPTFEVWIKSVTWEAPNITSYELYPMDVGELPAFSAGAHIDIKLGNGLIRSYSLVNSQTERHRYVIAVQKDRSSRGGSRWIHENVRPGDVLSIRQPRNNFTLNEDAERSLFIAGGIGITPILSMTDRLSALRRDWELIYCARTAKGAAFRDQLEGRNRVHFHFDEEPGSVKLDLVEVVNAAPRDAHLYCCGPLPMLAAFEIATAGFARERVHVEYFTGTQPAATDGGFQLVLAKSGREFTVAPGKTILATLCEAGLDIPYSCMEGVCGTCETGVLEGMPDHRDLILTEAERAANHTMMICCSGSKSERLVLDL